MPSRTLSPRISTTVMTMSLLMTIDSFFFLDSTSIGVYLSVSENPGAVLRTQLRCSAPSEASPLASVRTPSDREPEGSPSSEGGRGFPVDPHLSWRGQPAPSFIFLHCKSG